MLKRGDWAIETASQAPCQVVDVEEVWGSRAYRVWLPTQSTVLRVAEPRLVPYGARPADVVCNELAFVSAAARIADAMARDALVSPLEGTVIPLPHQVHALARAMSSDRVRYLLADEVGLGKTVEAGLIFRELKIRGLVRRVLVVAPAGLVTQWVQELKTHFDETFRLVIPSDLSAVRELVGLDEEANAWRLHDQVVCPLDSVKPLDARRGWTREQVARFNRERFDDLVSAGWDLIIIDEAHRLGGSTDQVARYRLGEALGQAAPYLLLLSATPHQGKTDGFRRLISFLDPQAFPDDDSVSQARVAPYVIRTEKRRAIDAEGNPLFKPRRTQLVAVTWGAGGSEQQALYSAVTDYVRDGYNQAIQDQRRAIGFLMILMQRLVTSSTRAIRQSLERRLEVLELPEGQLSLFGEDIGDAWGTLDGQEQLESVLKSRLKGLKNERAEVELLLSAARRCEAKGPDAKAQALLEHVHRLQREEADPLVKVLVFTEFVPTQEMLATYLQERGFRVTCLNGSMGLDERRSVQRAFADDAQVLISTDAGGEGLNLQFCHVIVNYDLPWNPMKIEQRIGRVDRIGQKHVVQALNFALQDTVELRVREVLEAKLAKILEEFGVDKLADVLDSEEGGPDFEDLYVAAMRQPDKAVERAEALAAELRSRALAARDGTKVLGPSEPLSPEAAQRLAGHQVPFWTERMTLAYLRSRRDVGARVEADDVGYTLRWPDGTELARATFAPSQAHGARHVTLEEPHVRGIAAQLGFFAPGNPITSIVIPEISDKVSGLWSLWRVALDGGGSRARRILPLFVSDDGRVLGPTARVVWERVLELDPDHVRLRPAALVGEPARAAYEDTRRRAEEAGRPLYDEILGNHRRYLEQEKQKSAQAISSRRRAIERIGLPQVRDHRLAQLVEEEKTFAADLAARSSALPELSAILVVRVAALGELS
ncbi:MAG: DEAD/DEAH box helicase family protein [Proteobacteria bacterium]|nr:DEAD/DEAH box helicase family protein [Pseudomonadota bacterium]